MINLPIEYTDGISTAASGDLSIMLERALSIYLRSRNSDEDIGFYL